MKKLFLSLSALLTVLSVSAQKPTVESLKGLDLQRIDHDPATAYDLPSNMKDKVVLIEFWEFWCGPCIQNMLHFRDLQKAFPDDLKIIYVSSDDLNLAREVSGNNDYGFDFIHDAKKQLTQLFPHQVIPHTVVYDKQGKYIGETHPVNISEQTIRDLINGKSVGLPSVTPPEAARVSIEQPKPQTSDMPSLYMFDLKKMDPTQNSKSARSTNTLAPGNAGRMTKIEVRGYNVSDFMSFLSSIPKYRIIYPAGASWMGSEEPQHRYDLTYSSTLWANNFMMGHDRNRDSFWPILLNIFGITARVEQRETDVWILKEVRENEKIKEAKPYQQSGERPVVIGADYAEFKTGRGRIDGVTKSLEDMLETPIIIESGEKWYEMNMRIDFGGKRGNMDELRNTVFEELNKAGLVLEKGKREVDFLILESAAGK